MANDNLRGLRKSFLGGLNALLSSEELPLKLSDLRLPKDTLAKVLRRALKGVRLHIRAEVRFDTKGRPRAKVKTQLAEKRQPKKS